MILHRVHMKQNPKHEQEHKFVRSVVEYKGHKVNDFLEVVYRDGKQLYKIVSVYKKFEDFADVILVPADMTEIDKELSKYGL